MQIFFCAFGLTEAVFQTVKVCDLRHIFRNVETVTQTLNGLCHCVCAVTPDGSSAEPSVRTKDVTFLTFFLLLRKTAAPGLSLRSPRKDGKGRGSVLCLGRKWIVVVFYQQINQLCHQVIQELWLWYWCPFLSSSSGCHRSVQSTVEGNCDGDRIERQRCW